MQKPNVLWVGTGVMGAAMATHLLAAGYRLTLHNRTRAKAEALIAAGAGWSDTPGAAAATAEVVALMVGYPHDVEELALHPHGILNHMRPGTLFIDFTTSSPRLAARLAQAAEARGISALDAPVSGGDIGAREARLSIMVGGTTSAYKQALPLLRCLGKTIVHHGPAGAGQHVKMVNQILIAANMLGVCEGLLYAESAGLDPQKTLDSVGGGAAASWSLQNLYPRMTRGDFQPGFYVEHFIKDLGIALSEANAMQLALPGLALARQLYEAVRAGGGARLGTQALLLTLKRLNAR